LINQTIMKQNFSTTFQHVSAMTDISKDTRIILRRVWSDGFETHQFKAKNEYNSLLDRRRTSALGSVASIPPLLHSIRRSALRSPVTGIPYHTKYLFGRQSGRHQSPTYPFTGATTPGSTTEEHVSPRRLAIREPSQFLFNQPID
jgi:hypothetical protein